MTEPRSLLLVQLYHLGDVLLATPAVRAARRAFPHARIDFVTGAAGAEALGGNAQLNAVHVWERGVRPRLRLMRALRDARYDAVVDFHSRPSTAQLVLATRATVRIGLEGRGPRTLAYTHVLPRERGPVYMALQKLRLLAPLGIDPRSADLRLELTPGDADREHARATLRAHGLDAGAPVVAISPVSRHAFKQWGSERWAAVADRLADAGARILITSGPGELDQAAAVAAAMRNPAVWRYGETSVKQLAALYQRCTLWLGNDGGAKHVAAAVGTPTIAVTRWRLGPVWSDTTPGSGQLAFDPPPPQGCDRDCPRCEHIGCLAAVSVDDVADAALARLRPVSLARRHA
jgi:ADP-heptose:LPS heptosyltransferase